MKKKKRPFEKKFYIFIIIGGLFCCICNIIIKLFTANFRNMGLLLLNMILLLAISFFLLIRNDLFSAEAEELDELEEMLDEKIKEYEEKYKDYEE